MKVPSLLAATLLALAPLAAPAAPPALGIEQALKLAMDHLRDRGLSDAHYISSLTLEDSAITGGVQYWYARWVPSIKADQTTESGLQISMDGSLARVVSGPGSGGAGRPDNPGQRRIGSRNIR